MEGADRRNGGGVPGRKRRCAPPAHGVVFVRADAAAETRTNDVSVNAAPSKHEELHRAPADLGLASRASQPRKRTLDTLDASELSSCYGLGYELLRRMGYNADQTSGTSQGLRADALEAPLRPYEQGRDDNGRVSRRGLGAPDDIEELPQQVPLAFGSDNSTQSLLEAALCSMREAGDAEEAEEIYKLAACVGSLEEVPAQASRRGNRRKMKKASGRHAGRAAVGGVRSAGDSSDSDSSSAALSAGAAAADAAALKMVLDCLQHEAHFPVELAAQESHVDWRSKWEKRLGSYECFIERHADVLRLIRCPAPHGPLVLPCDVPGSNHGWVDVQRYVSWCRDRRLESTGRAKKKWMHVEKSVRRLCAILDRASSMVAHSGNLGIDVGTHSHFAGCVAKADDEQASSLKADPADGCVENVDQDQEHLGDLGWFEDCSGHHIRQV